MVQTIHLISLTSSIPLGYCIVQVCPCPSAAASINPHKAIYASFNFTGIPQVIPTELQGTLDVKVESVVVKDWREKLNL